MTEEERRQVAEVTVKTAEGKIPVTVHVGTADSLSAGATKNTTYGPNDTPW